MSNCSLAWSLRGPARTAKSFRDLGRFETQICSWSIRSRMTEAREQFRFETRHSDLFRCTHMKTRVQDAPRVVRHKDMHLSLRKRFHVEILDAILFVLSLGGCPRFLVPFMNKQPLLRQTIA